jgi:hypothetical protein
MAKRTPSSSRPTAIAPAAGERGILADAPEGSRPMARGWNVDPGGLFKALLATGLKTPKAAKAVLDALELDGGLERDPSTARLAGSVEALLAFRKDLAPHFDRQEYRRLWADDYAWQGAEEEAAAEMMKQVLGFMKATDTRIEKLFGLEAPSA